MAGVSALFVALGVVFVAEMGDKSQLVALSLATRFSPAAALAGITVAVVVLHALAVTAGVALAQAIPERALGIGSGLVFLVFAVASLLRREQSTATDDEVAGDEAASGTGRLPRQGRSALVVAGLTFFVSEFGDKTQLAVATLATTRPALPTAAGAVIGMVAADALAVLAGAGLRRKLAPRVIRLISAAGFAITGVIVLATA